MIDGGAIAKSRFRFQDMCAMYFSLKKYIQQSTNFDYIYCEQDKLDFEIWSYDNFSGYQVKNIKNSIKATEVNSILGYYINKADKSRKNKRDFYFIFAQKPKNSLHYLLLKLGKNIGIKKYYKTAEKYIKTALNDLIIDNINIDYHCYNIDEIEYLACDISRRILKNKLNINSDFPSEVIQDFLSRLRDELDIISSRNNPVERIYKLNDIDNLVNNFISRVKLTKFENEGEKETKVKGLPIIQDKSINLQPTKLTISNVTEGKAMISHE